MCSSGPQSDVRDTAWRTLVMSMLHLPRFVNGFKPPDVNEYGIPVLKRFDWRSLCQWFRKLYTPVYSAQAIHIRSVWD